MRNRVLSILLVFLLSAACWGQGQVLASSGGYQLTMTQMEPALELLAFMTQEPLSPDERRQVITESVEEFQGEPASTLQSLAQLQSSLQLVQSKNDPMVLGEFRQKMLAEFYKMSQSTPANEMPAFLKVLNAHAPVVAYDPNTGVALTQKDLAACLLYMQQLGAMQGESYSEQDLLSAGQQVIEGFQNIDPETQKMLASGALYIALYQGNTQRMNLEQKSNLTSHYRTTMGGPPVTRGGGEPEEIDGAGQLLSKITNDGQRRNQTMMKSLQESGGSTDYWSVVK